MYTHETALRVRYGETDQMGFAYHGDYASWFEVARVEALRHLGLPYRRLEEEGVQLPVFEMHARFHAPARYDDALTIRTTVRELPGVRFTFHYQVLGPEDALLTEASTTLVFMDRATRRPRRAPQELLDALAPYFTS